MTRGEAIRIVVVDDQPVVRGGLVALLRSIRGLDVVGEASDGASAVEATAAHEPDVVLMDEGTAAPPLMPLGAP